MIKIIYSGKFSRGGALRTGYSFSRMCGLSNYRATPGWIMYICVRVQPGVTRGLVPSSFSQMQLNTKQNSTGAGRSKGFFSTSYAQSK